MDGEFDAPHHGRGRRFAPFLMLMCSLASKLWCGYETPSALYSEDGLATLLYTKIGYKTIVDEDVIVKLDSAYHYLQDPTNTVGKYSMLEGLQYKLKPLKLDLWLDEAEDEDDDGSDSDDDEMKNDLSLGSNNNDNSKHVETRRSSLRSSSRNGSGSGSSGISDNSNGNGSVSANTKDNDKSGVNNDKKLPTGVYKTKEGTWCVQVHYQRSNRQIGTWPTLEQATTS